MSANQGECGEPNLTPLLDLVFQLITFFMLVINFKSAAMDLDLKLPVIGSARPVEGGTADLLILNVNTEGKLKVYGELKEDINKYIAGEAQVSLMAMQKTHPELKPGDELPSTVVIRSDRATRFKALNVVIKACQDNGYRNFAFKAMSKPVE